MSRNLMLGHDSERPMDGSLAQLLEYWIRVAADQDKRELVILVLETVRDDLSQAHTKSARPVVNASDVQVYLGEQIAELRQLCKQARQHRERHK